VTITGPITIAARFCGPPGIANGGYVAGLLAERLGSSAEVTLRRPLPLDRPLTVVERHDTAGLRVVDGGETLAEADVAVVSIEPHPSVSFEEAVEARGRGGDLRRHQFAGCFVCGPGREPGDGLRIQPGPLRGRPDVVAPWVPDESLGGEWGLVRTRYTWAALDCSGAYALHNSGVAPTHLLLGRIRARLVTPVSVGERCVVVGWAHGTQEGRRFHARTALYHEDGWLSAVAEQTWFEAPFEVPPPG
jgi:hypothetical protein